MSRSLASPDRQRGVQVDIERTQKQCAARAGHRLRQELRIEKRRPEVLRFRIDGPNARIEHEGRNAGNQNQADPRRQGVDPADGDVGLFRQPAPVVEEDEGRRQLDHKEHPFGGPTEDERADERFRGQRRTQADRPPDAHARDGAKHDRDENEEPGMAVEVIEVVAVARAIGVARLDGQEEPSAHRVMRNQDMNHRNDGDQHRRR